MMQKKMKNKTVKRIFACMLAATICVSAAPMTAITAGATWSRYN